MTTSLARIQPEAQSTPTALARFQPQNLEQAMQAAEMLSKAGDMIPAHLQGKPAAVLATLLAGAELGIGMMESFRAITLIKGKVGFYADFMLAKAKMHTRCASFDMITSTAEVATFEVKERTGKVTRMSFTMADAAKAGLTSNANYQRNGAAMLRARCISALVKVTFPDAFFGAYAVDGGEMADVETTERDVTPVPQQATEQVNQQTTKQLPLETATQATVRAMKARMEAKPVQVVDVAPDETEEQATARVANRPYQAFSDAQLSTALDDAHNRLQDLREGSKTHVGLSARLRDLEAELSARLPTASQ